MLERLHFRVQAEIMQNEGRRVDFLLLLNSDLKNIQLPLFFKLDVIVGSTSLRDDRVLES